MSGRGLIGSLAAALIAALSLFATPAVGAKSGAVDGNAERRVALVIGNAAYRQGALKNPIADARAVAASLRELGFEVTLRENLAMRPMIESMRDFSVRAPRYDVRVLYFAGHGIQSAGRNYLLPVDADIRSEEEIPSKGADIGELVDRLAHLPSGNSVVILDACRSNPFRDMQVIGPDGRAMRIKSRGSAPAGLAEMAPPAGIVVAYSADRGQVALDGVDEANSLYTKHLLANLPTPGQTLEQLFRRVRAGVYAETKGYQRPYEEGSLFTDFCFRPTPGGRCGTELLVDPSRAPAPATRR